MSYPICHICFSVKGTHFFIFLILCLAKHKSFFSCIDEKKKRELSRFRPIKGVAHKAGGNRYPARLAKSAQEVGGVEAAVAGSGAEKKKKIFPSGVGGVGRKHGWR